MDSGELPTRLRIGILLDSVMAPAWVRQLLQELKRSDFAEIAFVVFENAAKSRTKPRWDTFLFTLWGWFDYHIFRNGSDAFKRSNISVEISGVPVTSGLSVSNDNEIMFTDAAIAAIRAANLDVFLLLSNRRTRGGILTAAKYGVWDFQLRVQGGVKQRHALGLHRPGLYCTDENCVCETSVQWLDPAIDGGRILCRSCSSMNASSRWKNLNTAYWKRPDMLMRRLAELKRFGWNFVESANACLAEIDQRREEGAPDNYAMARFLAGWSAKTLRRKFLSLFYTEKWFIAFRHRQNTWNPSGRLNDYKIIPSPPNHYYADPFVFERDGRNYIFFEDYRVEKRKAVISCVELDNDGNYYSPEVALERSYHLSYPFLFEWQGQIYLMPETRSARTVEIYRSIEFPSRWQLEKVLMDGVSAVDSTIVAHDGRLWLFAAMQPKHASINNELLLFYADSPFGPWTAHPMNPIVSDVRRARPAGQIYVQNGHLIRPGQDCSKGYGYAICLNRIETLTTTSYREVPVAKITPDRPAGFLRIHTLNQSGKFETIDGIIPVERWLTKFLPLLRMTRLPLATHLPHSVAENIYTYAATSNPTEIYSEGSAPKKFVS